MRSQSEKIDRGFAPLCWLSCFFLGLAAIAKLSFVSQEIPLLAQSHPIFSFMTVRQILLLVALAEMGAFLAVVLLRSTERKLLTIAVVGAVLVAYRVTSYLLGITEPCQCLGNLGQALHIPDHTLSSFTTGLAVFWFLTGIVGVALLHSRRSEPNGFAVSA